MSAIQDDPVKTLTPVFWVAVAAVVLSLGGGIYTAVTTKKAAEEQNAKLPSIPLPAMPTSR